MQDYAASRQGDSSCMVGRTQSHDEYVFFQPPVSQPARRVLVDIRWHWQKTNWLGLEHQVVLVPSDQIEVSVFWHWWAAVMLEGFEDDNYPVLPWTYVQKGCDVLHNASWKLWVKGLCREGEVPDKTAVQCGDHNNLRFHTLECSICTAGLWQFSNSTFARINLVYKF